MEYGSDKYYNQLNNDDDDLNRILEIISEGR